MLEYAHYPVLLMLLAGLIAFLHFRLENRQRAENPDWQPYKEMPPGEAFDVSAIAPQIEQLRQDHVAARHPRPHDGYYRKGLLATAREAVTSLSFFQRAGREDNKGPAATEERI